MEKPRYQRISAMIDGYTYYLGSSDCQKNPDLFFDVSFRISKLYFFYLKEVRRESRRRELELP